MTNTLADTLTCAKTGQALQLKERIAQSGEGSIWTTNAPGHLAKIYANPTLQRIQKLEVMVAHPPREPNAHLDHTSFAWPLDLLINRQGQCEGFLMSHITDSVELIQVYNPRQRQRNLPTFNWLYLHTTAMNIASIVWAIHEAGYVLGDIKPQNLLVNNRALPAIVDTDSFQVRHPVSGAIFHCGVGTEGFTPPELLDQDLAHVTQEESHDCFRLAVVIYHLLFGDHPFKGRWTGADDSPDPGTLVRRGLWPYGTNSLIQPGPLTIPLEILYPGLQQAFLQCFNQGHQDPTARPSAQRWVQLLKQAIADLEHCHRQKSHYYAASSTFRPHSSPACYWCDRKQSLGLDVFAAPGAPSANAKPFRKKQRLRPEVRSQRQARSPQPISPAPSQNPPRMPQKTFQTPLPANSPQPQSSRQSIVSPSTSPITLTSPSKDNRFSLVDVLARNQSWGDGSKNQGMVSGAIALGVGVLLVGLLVGLFTLLVIASRTYITPEEMGPTILGSVAFLGLVIFGAVLLRLLPQDNI